MERSTRIDEQLWRAEACAAVQGDERWTCLTATIAGGGSERLAVYRMQLTGARRTVALADGAASGVAERRAEIRRRLGIADTIAPQTTVPLRTSAPSGMRRPQRTRLHGSARSRVAG
jgi:hypothetical protein